MSENTNAAPEIDWAATEDAGRQVGIGTRYGNTVLTRTDVVVSTEVAMTFDYVPNGEPLVWLDSAQGFLPASLVRSGAWDEDDILAPVDVMPEWDERWFINTAGHLCHATIVDDSEA